MTLRFPPNSSGNRSLFGAGFGALGAGQSASDRRFQLSLLEQTRQIQQRQLEGLSDVLAQSDENQRRISEIQNSVTEALAEAVRIQTDAVNAIEAAQNTDRDEANRRLESVETLLSIVRDQIGLKVEELDRRMNDLVSPNGNLVVREAGRGVVFLNESDSRWLRLRALEDLTAEVTLMNPENI